MSASRGGSPAARKPFTHEDKIDTTVATDNADDLENSAVEVDALELTDNTAMAVAVLVENFIENHGTLSHAENEALLNNLLDLTVDSTDTPKRRACVAHGLVPALVDFLRHATELPRSLEIVAFRVLKSCCMIAPGVKAFLECDGLQVVQAAIDNQTVETVDMAVVNAIAAIVRHCFKPREPPLADKYFETVDVNEMRAKAPPYTPATAEEIGDFFPELNPGAPLARPAGDLSAIEPIAVRDITHKPNIQFLDDVEPETYNTTLDADLLEVVQERLARCLENTENDGHVVYDRSSPNGLAGQQEPPPPPKPADVVDEDALPDLMFESRFEGGNLFGAIRVAHNEYDLVLSPDLNRRAPLAYMHTFFFSVSNMTARVPYKFNIVNLEKAKSLYNQGMKVLAYSKRLEDKEGRGWFRMGDNISYFRNHYLRPEGSKQKYYYTATFTLEFPVTNDTVYLAYHYPYTYTQLIEHMIEWEAMPHAASRMKTQELCRTISGNPLHLLTITNFDDDDVASQAADEEGGEEDTSMFLPLAERDYIVITSRVHCGESNSSWMLKGIVEGLLADTPLAHQLVSRFIFKIVPMLCPDGIINGNHRVSLIGRDLNRTWDIATPEDHPETYYSRTLIEHIKDKIGRDPWLYCDLHGHSRRKMVFLYGNGSGGRDEKLFAKVLDARLDSFDYDQCCFAPTGEEKSGTARACVGKMGILQTYTVETSYAGSVKKHFTIEDIERVGHGFLEGVFAVSSTADSADLAELLDSLDDAIDEESDHGDEMVEAEFYGR